MNVPDDSAYDRAASPAARSALNEATAIARSTALRGEIDWTKEPLTQRERRIRQRYLERLPLGAAALLDARVRLAKGYPFQAAASDLALAAELDDVALRERARRRIQDVMAQILMEEEEEDEETDGGT